MNLSALLGAAALAVVAFLFAMPAGADHGHRVVVLDSPSHDELEAEVLTRVRAELGAAGFEVAAVTIADKAEARVTVETAARDLAPAVVLMIQGRGERRPGGHPVELWLSDFGLGRTLVQELSFEHADLNRRAAQMAVMAVEILKAHFAELTILPELRRPAPAPAPVARPVVVEVPSPRETPKVSHAGEELLEVEAAASLLYGFHGVDQVWIPTLRVGFTLPGRPLAAPVVVELRASVGAFGQESVTASGPSSAHITQSFGTADMVAHFFPELAFQPLLFIGTGAYVTNVSGQAPPGFLVTSQRTWSALATVGAGAWVKPLRQLALVVEAQLMTAWSRTVVRIDEREVAVAGAPMAMLSTGIAGVF